MLFYRIPLKDLLEIESILQYKFFLSQNDIYKRDYMELMQFYDKLVELKEQEKSKEN